MQIEPNAKLLRIFVGEIDKLHHRPLYEAVLQEARKADLAGCTILRGILSFGASSIIHKAKLIDISEDLPIVIEIVDDEARLEQFIKTVGAMLETAGCGGLITLEKATVLHYLHAKKPNKRKNEKTNDELTG